MPGVRVSANDVFWPTERMQQSALLPAGVALEAVASVGRDEWAH